jgi:WD40 repeat protein
VGGGRLNRGGLPALVWRGAGGLGAVGSVLAWSVLAGPMAAGAASQAMPPKPVARAALVTHSDTLRAAVQRVLGRSWGGQGGPSSAGSGPARWDGTSRAGSAGSQQGFSVAISGNVAVAGAPGVNGDTGSASLWQRQGGPFRQVATLPDPRRAKGDHYGWAVAVSSTKSGTYVAIGGNESNGKRDLVYIYKGSGKTWLLQATLPDPNSHSKDMYGEAMAISGTAFVVGAPGVTGNEGKIYIYQRSGHQWNLQATEGDPGDAANDLFGRSVSTSGDEVLAGAADAAYVFTNESGNQWTQTAVLRNPGSPKDNFGYAVNIDAAMAVAGAPGSAPGTGSPLSAGAAYVFTHKGSTWSSIKLTGPTGTKGDEFGYSITETSNKLLIGMPVYGKTSCGTVFTFAPNNNTWTFQGQVLDPSCSKGDEFGFSAALLGATGVIGAPNANDGDGAVFFLPLPPTSAEATLQDPGSTGVPAVAFSLAGSTLAAGDLDGSTYLWDVGNHTLTSTLRNPNGQGVFGTAFSPDGNTLAVGTANKKYTTGSIYLWHISPRKLTTLHDPDGHGVDAIAFSPDGKILATAGDDDGNIYLWDVSSRKVMATLTDPASQGVNGVAFTDDGAYLASADSNGHAYVWDVSSKALVANMTDPATKGVNGVAFSPNGHLAVADGNGHAYVWEAPGKIIATLTDPASQSVDGVAFSPNGAALATTTINKTVTESGVCVWDVATSSLIATFHDPGSEGAFRLAYSPDGNTIAVGDGNAHTYLWDMSWFSS